MPELRDPYTRPPTPIGEDRSSRAPSRRPRRVAAVLAAIPLLLALLAGCGSDRDPVPLRLSIEGGGAVEINGDRYSAGRTLRYPAGTRLAIEPRPDTGSVFVGWGGACAGEADERCEFTLNTGADVTAAFAAGVLLTVAVDGSGVVTSDPAGIGCTATASPCVAAFDVGTEVVLTTSTDAGSAFAGFAGDCEGRECRVTMDVPRAVEASFAAAVDLSVAFGGTGDGAVLVDGARLETDGVVAVPRDVSVSVEAVPGSGSTFAGWGGTCAGTVDPTCTAAFTADAEVFVAFDLVDDATRVGFTGDGTGFVITGDGLDLCRDDCAVVTGDGRELIAAAATGSTFTGWSGCAETSGASCTVGAPGEVTATFAAATAPALGPVGTGCDGVEIGEMCVVSLAVVNPEAERVRGLEVALDGAAFAIENAEPAPIFATAGCLVGHGPREIAMVCEGSAAPDDGSALITVTLRRTGPLPDVIVASEGALVYADAAGGKRAVEGGALGAFTP